MRLVRSIAGTLAVASLGASLSCSLVLDFPQCVEDLDCTNAEGTELVCRDSQCLPPIPPETVACETHADCVAVFDDAHLCGPSNVCAALNTDRCELRVRPEGAPEDFVYVGSILPRTGTYDELGVPLENAMQLAVEDFNQSTRLPGERRVGWMACDSAGSASQATDAARDLIAAGVRVVVGPALSSELIDVANETAINDVLLISPTASASVLGQLDDENLVWRTIGNDQVQAVGIADRVASLDPAPERVVMLVKNDLYGDGLRQGVADRLAGRLPDNGLTTLKYSPLDAFDGDTDALENEYGMRLANVFGSEPDVVIILGSVEAHELLRLYLESWSVMEPFPPLPRFIVSHEALASLEPTAKLVADGFRPTLMQRLEGVGPVSQDANNFDAWEIRYGVQFEADDNASLSGGLVYDAAMVSMLALSGLPEGGGTGTQIAEAIGRLADKGGTPISFGEGLSFITAAQEVLDGGGTVDLQGVSGDLDFDLASGDIRSELDGWSLEPIPGTTAAPALVKRRRYQLDAPPAVTGTWVDL